MGGGEGLEDFLPTRALSPSLHLSIDLLACLLCYVSLFLESPTLELRRLHH